MLLYNQATKRPSLRLPRRCLQPKLRWSRVSLLPPSRSSQSNLNFTTKPVVKSRKTPRKAWWWRRLLAKSSSRSACRWWAPDTKAWRERLHLSTSRLSRWRRSHRLLARSSRPRWVSCLKIVCLWCRRWLKFRRSTSTTRRVALRILTSSLLSTSSILLKLMSSRSSCKRRSRPFRWLCSRLCSRCRPACSSSSKWPVEAAWAVECQDVVACLQAWAVVACPLVWEDHPSSSSSSSSPRDHPLKSKTPQTSDGEQKIHYEVGVREEMDLNLCARTYQIGKENKDLLSLYKRKLLIINCD